MGENVKNIKIAKNLVLNITMILNKIDNKGGLKKSPVRAM